MIRRMPSAAMPEGYSIVFGYLGVFLMLIAGILCLPLFVLIAYPNEVRYAPDFLIPAALALVAGLLLRRLLRGLEYKRLSLQQDSVIIVVGWLAAAFLSGLPFMLAGQLNFTQAMFEAVSGWTTTGLSVVNVAVAPKIFLMHRSIMQFFGGVGIVLVMVSALSGTYGMRLYSAEGHSDRLLPNLAKSARTIMGIYAGYIVAGMLLYMVFGMSWFDAINHSIAALSTGGFSTRTLSIEAFHSVPIDIITIVLMILGTTNFAAHLLLIRGKLKDYLRMGETKFMYILLIVAIPLVAFVSLDKLYHSVAQGMLQSAFNIVSALSTTGFSTTVYNNWPPFAMLAMIVVMLIGGGAGSTAGGIKLYRVYLILKSALWSVRQRFFPENVMNKDYVYRPDGKQFVEPKHVSEVSLYGFIYLVLFFVGVSILTAYGYPLEKSMFEFASSLGTVGLSVGITSPTAPVGVLWTEIGGMLFGRLEIYAIFIAAIQIARDTRRSIKGFADRRTVDEQD